MYLGVIIVFSEITTDLDLLKVKDFIKKTNCKVCLVNNGTNKEVQLEINELEHLYNNVLTLNIKKSKNINTVVKLGTRLLNSIFDFSLIVFLDSTDAIKLDHLFEKLTNIKTDKEKYTPISTRSKREIFSQVFSIKELYSKII
jgi:hypothetical protein